MDDDWYPYFRKPPYIDTLTTVGYSDDSPILDDVASCLMNNSSCSILKMCLLFVGKLMCEWVCFQWLTNSSVFLWPWYWQLWKCLLLNIAQTLMAWAKEPKQKITQLSMPLVSVLQPCPCQDYTFCPVRNLRRGTFSSFHRSITPIGMAGMAPDSGIDSNFIVALFPEAVGARKTPGVRVLFC